VTGVARPGSVLCTEEVHGAAPDRFDWSFAGKHKLKGMSEPISLYRARRPRADEAGEADEQEASARQDKQNRPSSGEDATKKRSKADRRRTRAAS